MLTAASLTSSVGERTGTENTEEEEDWLLEKKIRWQKTEREEKWTDNAGNEEMTENNEKEENWKYWKDKGEDENRQY